MAEALCRRLITVLLAAAFGSCIPAVRHPATDTAEAAAGRAFLAEAVVVNWWPLSALAARRLLDQYGVPDEVRPEELVWHGRGPWRRTVARNVTPPYVKPVDLGVVRQSIRYTLTPEQIAALKAFDRRLAYETGARELEARSDREEVNYLRMNLANDLIKGRVNPEQARHLYERMLKLENTGKTSPYMLGLKFQPEP